MQHPRWRPGKLSTGFIAEEFPDGFHPRRAGGRDAPTPSPRSRPPSTTCWASASASISGQMTGRAVTRERRRVGQARRRRDRRSTSRARPAASRCSSSMPTATPGMRACWCRPGSRASRSGPARSTAQPVAVQVRPIPNGFALAHRGVEAKAHVYTAREAAAARLMPVKKARRHRQAAALPDAGPGRVDRRDGRPGGQGRRDARRGRGDEDGERAARRARRHGARRSTPSRATASRSMR